MQKKSERKGRRGFKILRTILFVLLIVLMAAYLVIRFWPSIGKLPSREAKAEYARRTGQYYDGRFHNTEELGFFLDKQNKKSEEVRPKEIIKALHPNNIARLEESGMQITWLGHSTSLLQMHGLTILIDPELSDYSSPSSLIGGKRFSEVPIEPEDLPEIDLVLISHADYDHLDYASIRKIDSKVKAYVAPLGVESYLQGWGVDPAKIHSVAWWDDLNIGGLQISFTQAQHYCVRNPIAYCATWWGGYFLQDEYHSFYFTGDSGYGDFFREVYERYGAPELFLTDTGQYDPAWYWCHMTPEEAVQAAKEVHAVYHMPVHWGAFALANHAWNAPPRLVTEYEEDLPVQTVTPRLGETVNVLDMENYQNDWWKENR